MATTKPTTPRKRTARKPKAPKLETVQRVIGDETHPWCSELGGIPQPFGPPAESSHGDEETAVAASEEAPHAPVDGKVPTLELTPILTEDSQ